MSLRLVVATIYPLKTFFCYKITIMEIWKDIKGYEGLYKVSNLGRVKSLDKKRFNVHNNTFSSYREIVLSPRGRGRDGNYSAVRLYKNGYNKEYAVHRLVGQAFLGLDIENKLSLVLHKKEDLNEQGLLYNGVDNLFLGNHSDNALDAVSKGRHKRGIHDKKQFCDFAEKEFNLK